MQHCALNWTTNKNKQNNQGTAIRDSINNKLLNVEEGRLRPRSVSVLKLVAYNEKK